jgi:hypothetical protein
MATRAAARVVSRKFVAKIFCRPCRGFARFIRFTPGSRPGLFSGCPSGTIGMLMENIPILKFKGLFSGCPSGTIGAFLKKLL